GDLLGRVRRPILNISFALTTFLLACVCPTNAQQEKKVPRIGYLSNNDPATISVRVDPFRRGLRELGYVEGKNIFIEWRFAEGKPDRLSALAAELARLQVDIIVTSGRILNPAAKEATSTIPLFITPDSQPVS